MRLPAREALTGVPSIGPIAADQLAHYDHDGYEPEGIPDTVWQAAAEIRRRNDERLKGQRAPVGARGESVGHR